jgi:O-antigen/teichoic acid export membrane protein
MSPVMIRALGNRDYGLWELVMSVIGYMGLLDLGIGSALVRFVAVADGKQDQEDFQRTISTAFAFFLCVGVVAMLVFFSLGYSPQVIAGSEIKDIANLGTVFFLLGLNAALLFPMQVFITTLMGVQRHYFINSTRGVLTIVRAVTTFYMLQHYPGKGLVVLAFLTPVFNFVQLVLLVGAIYCDKKLPKLSFLAVTKEKLKELLSYAAKSATMLVASRLQNQSVPFIISQVIGLSQIVYFVMPNRLIEYASGVSQSLGTPLMPYFGAAVGKGDQKDLLKSWLNTTLALQIVSLAMPVVIFFCGEVFLTLWIGREYAVSGRWVMYILLAGLIADALSSNSFRILQAQSRHGRIASVWLILSVLSIPIGILGASLWGVTGVTLGTTMVTVVGNLATIKMACSSMGVSLKIYCKETVFRLALPLLLLVVSLMTICKQFPANSYLILVIQLIFGFTVYIFAVWLFTLTVETRNKLYKSIYN